MEMESNKKTSIEKYLEETIYEYLQKQQDVPECYDFAQINELAGAEVQEIMKDEFTVQNLLNELLDEVDKTILFKEVYEEIHKEQHQYGLFDLKDIIADFYIGTNTYIIP